MKNTHVTDEEALALHDGVLSDIERARRYRHIEACAGCATRFRDVQGLDAVFSSAIDVIDAAEPSSWRRNERSATPAATIDPIADWPAPSARAGVYGRLQWAAIALFCAVGVASATTLWRGHHGNAAPSEIVKHETATASDLSSTVIVPVVDSLIVVIEQAGAGARVTVTFDSLAEDGAEIEVRGLASPTFRADGNALRIDLAGGRAAVGIALPSRVRVGRVEANGRTVIRFNRRNPALRAEWENGTVLSR